MVRRDALDLGVWTRVSPAQLIVPLDTHVIRVGRCLRLTRYTSPGWRMARDITASLRAARSRRSGEYDFALCHLGMMNACGFSRAAGGLRSVRCVGSAGHARSTGGGLGDHPLDGESLVHARESGRRPSAAGARRRSAARTIAVGQRVRDRAAARAGR